MDTDLAEKLHRQICRIESNESSSNESSLTNDKHQRSVGYELSHKQMQNLKKTFEKYDSEKQMMKFDYMFAFILDIDTIRIRTNPLVLMN